MIGFGATKSICSGLQWGGLEGLLPRCTFLCNTANAVKRQFVEFGTKRIGSAQQSVVHISIAPCHLPPHTFSCLTLSPISAFGLDICSESCPVQVWCYGLPALHLRNDDWSVTALSREKSFFRVRILVGVIAKNGLASTQGNGHARDK